MACNLGTYQNVGFGGSAAYIGGDSDTGVAGDNGAFNAQATSGVTVQQSQCFLTSTVPASVSQEYWYPDTNAGLAQSTYAGAVAAFQAMDTHVAWINANMVQVAPTVGGADTLGEGYATLSQYGTALSGIGDIASGDAEISAGITGGLGAIPTLDVPGMVLAGAVIRDGIAMRTQGWQDVDSPSGQAALDDIGSALGRAFGTWGRQLDFTELGLDVKAPTGSVASGANVPTIDKTYSPGAATIAALAKNMAPAAKPTTT